MIFFGGGQVLPVGGDDGGDLLLQGAGDFRQGAIFRIRCDRGQCD